MKRFAANLSACLLLALPASADEITDTLQSAIDAYESGDVQYALEELAFAQQLLNDLKAGALSAFLPAPPEGWTREEDDSGRMMQAFGGGTGVSATYSNGNDRFTLTILMDSPMVTAMGGLFSNAALLSSQGKLVRVGREKFLQQDDQLTGLIDGRVMVQVDGAEPDLVVPLLEQIDFRALGRFGL